jgi:hypothetical protein
MSFEKFVEALGRDDGVNFYLTTQYAAEDEHGEGEGESIVSYPPPTNALKDDFPSMPKLAGNLVLQQVNLWIGKSKNGSSSGLVRYRYLRVCYIQSDCCCSTMIFTITCIVYSRGTKDSYYFLHKKPQTSTPTAKSILSIPTA